VTDALAGSDASALGQPLTQPGAKTYLVTGAGGMLGQDVQRALAGREVRALTRSDLDITDAQAVRDALEGVDVVINCAAYTNVDGAEDDREGAFRVNAEGPAVLAEACAEAGAVLVHYSTDYVFHGDATMPYPEDGPYDPLNVYGESKAAGERAITEANGERSYIIRTAWLYGIGGPNFAKTMAKLAATKPEITVVDDQRGQPTWTADLAEQTVKLLDANAPAGIYHGTNSGEATWFEFAQEIFAAAGFPRENVKPTDSSAFVRPAARPAYSVLGHDAWKRAGLTPMRDWREAFQAAVAEGLLEQTLREVNAHNEANAQT